jgi:CubicO group peptidase (beta-lactamase class C family)
MLDVHVGQWPTDFDSREREQTAKYAQRMHVEKQLWVEEHIFSPLGMTGKNEARGRMQNRREAAEVAETVDPKAHWTGPEELGAILESGAFSVTGDVYFAPLQPFQPNPDIPESPEKVGKQLLSQQEISEYRYG